MAQLFSQTFSQSQQPACVQCGGTEYVLESGYYFCIECQVQSQDIREEVLDEFIGGQFRGARMSVPAFKSQEQVPDQIETSGKDITSWEALNIILNGLVHELVLLGAPKELKIVTLQLWACYLRKIEAVFLSKSVEKKPRLGLSFRKRDAQLVYGANNKTINEQKRPIHYQKRKLSPSRKDNKSDSSYSTRRSGSIQLTLKKKRLASAEYAASTSQSSVNSELTLENLSQSPSESSQKHVRFQYTKKAKSRLLDLLETAEIIEGHDRAYLQKRFLNKSSKSVEHATMMRLVAILRIALLYLNSEISLGDLFRFSHEGYLSVLNAEKLIPPNIKLKKDLKALFVTTLNSRETVNKNVTKMTDFLGIHGLKSRILPLIQRYLKELSLPSEMYSLISRLIALKPPQLKLNSIVNYEATALAYIIFMLKYLLGLDGVTEKYISNIAWQENKTGSRKLFNWCEWMKFINCRNSVFSYFHQGTRDLHYPTSRFGGANVFLSQWEKVPAKQTVPREHIIDRNLSECVRRIIKDLSQEPSEPLPLSVNSQSSMLENILKTKTLPSRTREILQYDFTSTSIEFLIEPYMQNEICAKHKISMTDKLAADFYIVKPLTGVANNSKVNPRINAKKNVTVKKITKFQETDYDLQKTLNEQKKKLENSRNVLPKVDILLKNGVTFENHTSPEDLSWSGVGRGYWVYHSSVTSKDVQSWSFDCLAESIFHPDFLWLLKEASYIGQVSPKDLYRELTKIETTYLKYLSSDGKRNKKIH